MLTLNILSPIALVFGFFVGSFLNVCIGRLPLGESVVFPRSRCTKCEKLIAWYDNVPILGWLMLRGKCRNCGQNFSFRYVVVEILTGLVAFALVRLFGLQWWSIYWFLFICTLIIVSFTDIDHRIIPNSITFPGIVVGFLVSFFGPPNILNLDQSIGYLQSLLGILVGGGGLLLLAETYRWLRKIDGMGMGDVKLLGMMGAVLGVQPLVYILLISSLLGTIGGLLMILIKEGDSQYQIPFGTFLSLAGVVVIFAGPQVEHSISNMIIHFLR